MADRDRHSGENQVVCGYANDVQIDRTTTEVPSDNDIVDVQVLECSILVV
jgi:hypothetical protein